MSHARAKGYAVSASAITGQQVSFLPVILMQKMKGPTTGQLASF
jgi:hypothetical protein